MIYSEKDVVVGMSFHDDGEYYKVSEISEVSNTIYVEDENGYLSSGFTKYHFLQALNNGRFYEIKIPNQELAYDIF